jgi:hypothetical protein
MKTIGKNLPTVTPEEASMATTLLGGALFNVLTFHALNFRDEVKFKALERAAQVARDATGVGNPTRGTEEERANAKQLALQIISQAETNARDELARRPQGESGKIN